MINHEDIKSYTVDQYSTELYIKSVQKNDQNII